MINKELTSKSLQHISNNLASVAKELHKELGLVQTSIDEKTGATKAGKAKLIITCDFGVLEEALNVAQVIKIEHEVVTPDSDGREIKDKRTVIRKFVPETFDNQAKLI